MYTVLRNFLEHAIYTVDDGQGRIDYHVARGNITPEQAQELAVIANARGTGDTREIRVNKLESAFDCLVRTEEIPSDKLGYNWLNTYIKDVLVRQEYVEAKDAEGTADNPIPWEPDVLLEANYHYTYEDVRKVWTGESGVTAGWDDERWEVF